MKDIARLYKVLSDEARLSMLWLLFNRGELCVCDFMQVLGFTQSKASRHLRALHHAGLVSDRRAGLWSYYRTKTARDAFTKAQMAALKASLSGRAGSARLLKKLEAWENEKEGPASCRA